MTAIRTLEEFVQVHGVLLQSAGLPPSLYSQLFHKLSSQLFDSGNFFHIEACENGKQRKLLLSCDQLPRHSQVFLIDHAWSFRLPDARNQLHQYPGLVERLSAMMCVTDDGEEAEVEPGQKSCVEDIISAAKTQAEEAGHDVCWLELDEADIDDDILQSLEISTKFPNLIGLSLWGNKISLKKTVLEVTAGFQHLKALWINENPIAVEGGHAAKETLLLSLPHLEMYNSKFTESYGKWALAFCAEIPSAKTSSFVDGLEDVKSLDLSDRDINRLHPKIFNPKEMPFLNALNLKGNPLDHETQATLLQTLRSLTNLQALEITIPGPLGRNGVEILESLPNLSILNGVEATKMSEQGGGVVIGSLQQRLPEWSATEPVEERLLRAMWAYLMTYRLCDEEKLDETPIWYVMDELGSAVRHSDDPNFRVSPFMYMPDGTLKSAVSYSLLWPIEDISEGEECTRDFLLGFGEDRQRSARLTAWFHTPKDYFEKVYRDFQERLKRVCIKQAISNASPTESIAKSASRHVLTVYTDLPQVVDTLKRPEFSFCDDPATADIIWTSTQIDDDLKRTLCLRDNQYVNQFPFEACIVMKHHLAKTIQEAHGTPNWLQTTYNMETEMAAFIGDYFAREKEGKNNLWIMKPWNMARTIDTSITDYLPALIRLAETGPKICQKYVEHPALYQGKKFDLRYIVLLRSLQPFEIFLSDVFWARISNNKYTLEKNSLTDYETHFTVMNYGRTLVHVNTHDFVPAFEKEHKVKWLDIHEKVRQMLRSIFEGAFSVQPEMHSATSRAIYGVDVLLTDAFEPKLLEVTYCPDCTRACKYDVMNVLGNGNMIKASEFFDDVFGCLFLNSLRNVSPL